MRQEATRRRCIGRWGIIHDARRRSRFETKQKVSIAAQGSEIRCATMKNL
jgi:hypothetical protein